MHSKKLCKKVMLSLKTKVKYCSRNTSHICEQNMQDYRHRGKMFPLKKVKTFGDWKDIWKKEKRIIRHK